MNKHFLVFLVAVFNLGLSSASEDRDLKITELESKLSELYDKKITEMPSAVRIELLGIEFYENLNKASKDTQIWLHNHLHQIVDVKISRLLENFHELRGGDDIYMINSQGFWSRLKGKPLDFENKIRLTGIYWKENDRPEIEFAPVGKGKINWIWKLEVKDRIHGVLHVGIDLKTRGFVCFENTVGIYYPEGDLLERIRAEIVQDPANAGTWLGKEYLLRKTNLTE